MKRIYATSLMAMFMASCGPLNDMNSSTGEMNGNVASMNTQMASVNTNTTHMATQMDNAVALVNHVDTSVTKIIAQLPLQTSQQNNQSDLQMLNLRYNFALKIALTKITGIDSDVLKDDIDAKLLSAVKKPVDLSSQTSAQIDSIAAYLGEASLVKQMVQNLKGNVQISPTLTQVIESTNVTLDAPQPSKVSEDEAIGKQKQVEIINHSLELLRK